MTSATLNAQGDASMRTAHAALCAVVVHWRNELELDTLLASWPQDPRFALCVVDNSATATALEQRHSTARWITPPSNVGFGGGVNLGLSMSSSRWVLLLNPDTEVTAVGLERLLSSAERALATDPRVALVAPRLLRQDATGTMVADQFRWQLRPLTKRRHLLAQCLFLGYPSGPRTEPGDGAAVEQPAAAALLLRRDALQDVGGFDERYFPAWFEDVDLAHRMAAAGYVGRYARSAEFVHAGGASVPSLGFARFLRIYYRNLQLFAGLRGWHAVARLAPFLLAGAAVLRLPLILVRKPRAAASRRTACTAFIQLAYTAVTEWAFSNSNSDLSRAAHSERPGSDQA